MFFVSVPEGAVATGLRTLGEEGGKPRWFDAELMEAGAAEARYRELTGIGRHRPKDPALLYWINPYELGLQVFPIAPASEKTVEYTLKLPVHYGGGRYTAKLPTMGTDVRPALLRVAGGDGDRLLVNGGKTSADATHALAEETLISLLPRAQSQLEASLAVVPVGDRYLVQYQARAAAALSQLPRHPYIVILIDTSRSRSTSELESSIAAARSYLGNFVGDAQARVQVLTFDREVQPQHARFVSAWEAWQGLPYLNAPRRNGTFLDLALERARDLLRQAPAGAARRLLLLTDMLTPGRATLERASEVVRQSGALLRVGITDGGDPALERFDEHPWAELARASGGILWNTTATDDEQAQEDQLAVYEHWARPVRIERIALDGIALPPALAFTPQTLDEGEEIDLSGFGTHALSTIVLQGELWSAPFRVAAQPSASAADNFAALALGDEELLWSLTTEEMTQLATRAGVVSPVTSYLAVEPGVRPSTEGIERAPHGVGASGFGGSGCLASVPHRDGAAFNHGAWIHDALAARWEMCGGEDSGLEITVETTRQELADIARLDPSDDAPQALLDCMRMLTWAITLPKEFGIEHGSFTATL